MILFLDFDGVLHPEQFGAADFGRRPILWEVLSACPHVDVVFSTSWREIYPQDELVEFVTRVGGEDMANRFISATPCPETARALFDRYGLRPEPDGYRLRECEILLWRQMNRAMERPWLAVDDFGHWFSRGCENLYLIDPKLGLQPDDVVPLIERLSGKVKSES